MTRALPALLLIVLWGAPAPARVPPDDEADLFGEDDDTPTPPKFSEKRFEAEDDKLQIGGSLYLRSIASFTDGTDVEDHTLSFPNIVELYLDGRPSDRLRGFVKGRLSWNPSVSEQSISNPVFEAFGFSTRDLTLQLDQLWLKFDISRRVYVTIGQQAVRWGATRIWNPVDVINTTFRTPLALFDTRTGVPLLKLHIPVETWNFYVLGMMSEVDTFDDAGVAARAEAVFSTVEVGVLGAYRKGSDPTVGVDVSAGVWDLDITSELGIRFEEANDDKAALQWSVGVEYGIKYSDEDVMYLAAEYFYNQRGRDTQDAWSDAATALAPGGDPETAELPTPFYTGEHYAALIVALPFPGTWNDTTIAISTIGNLTDRSFLTRIDWSNRVLTFMDIQLFAAAHYGNEGELRFGPGIFSDEIHATVESFGASLDFPTQVLELGLNLRIAL